ncbi:transmembrane protein 88-like [Pristis pectinata]|uniref:transmembrane protein 88-like n=1 Tax=Pristis pectinata TaxID=685728 RepID=UPI00223D08D5|nr:transmembrane protein 88-like [Pristis pectinata]
MSESSASAARGDAPAAVPPPYTPPGQGEGLELRSTLDCWACGVLISAHNLLVAALNLLLLLLVFTAVLLPTTLMVAFGLLCHSQVFGSPPPRCEEILDDGSSTALMVVGFVLLTPLGVLALAAYCRLARHLQLALCFVPYSKAVYRNLPAARYLGAGICCLRAGEGAGKVWV